MFKRGVSSAVAVLIVGLLAVSAIGLFGAEPSPTNRAQALEQRLRCPVCKSVSIADSPSSTASAMRRDVEHQVAAGRSDNQVIGYFRSRYGDWLLLDPPTHGNTLWLWLLPLAGAGAGIAVLVSRLRRSQSNSADLSPRQREHLERAVRDARLTLTTQEEQP